MLKWILRNWTFKFLINVDPERQTQYVLTHKWILDVKQRITRLQSTVPEKLGSKEDSKSDMLYFSFSLGRRNR